MTVVEAEPVEADNGTPRRDRGRSDDQVVRIAGPIGGSHGDEQFSVDTSDAEVVPDHRQAGDDVVEELPPGSSTELS